MRRSLIAIIALTLLAVSLVPALAGTIIVVSTREAAESATEELSTIYLDDRKMRFETSSGGTRLVIISRLYGDNPIYWVIDRGKGVYYEVTKAQVVEMKKQIDKLIATIEQQMALLTPENKGKMAIYKKRIEELGQTGVKLRYTQGKTGVRVGDWNTVEYKGYNGDELREHIWATSWQELGVDPDDVKVFEAMGDLFEAMGQEMSAFFQVKAEGTRGEYGFAGFPVRVVSMRGGSEVSQSVVEEVRRLPIDKDFFEIPPNLRRQPLFE